MSSSWTQCKKRFPRGTRRWILLGIKCADVPHHGYQIPMYLCMLKAGDGTNRARERRRRRRCMHDTGQWLGRRRLMVSHACFLSVDVSPHVTAGSVFCFCLLDVGPLFLVDAGCCWVGSLCSDRANQCGVQDEGRSKWWLAEAPDHWRRLLSTLLSPSSREHNRRKWDRWMCLEIRTRFVT